MTVRELIEALSDMPEDAQVRLAHQPSWPFEYGLREPVLATVTNPDSDDYDEEIVYIPEAGQLGYLPEAARDEIGW